MNKGKVLLIILFLVVILDNAVFAVESSEIPFELKIDNNSNQNLDRFKFVMVPKNVSNPMPQGSVDGQYSFIIDKAGKYTIPSIEFDTPGDYEYEVYQVKGDNLQYYYDISIYNVIVTVVNSEDFNSLETFVTITKDGKDEKYDHILFENTYFPPEVDVPDTSDINILLTSIIFIICVYSITKNKKIFLNK